VWLWWSRTGASAADADRCWQSFLRRFDLEHTFRDSKPGAALRHLPPGCHQVNTAWMRGALPAATTAAWLHQLTALIAGEDIWPVTGCAAARP